MEYGTREKEPRKISESDHLTEKGCGPFTAWKPLFYRDDDRVLMFLKERQLPFQSLTVN
jgi:hypothetical protein